MCRPNTLPEFLHLHMREAEAQADSCWCEVRGLGHTCSAVSPAMAASAAAAAPRAGGGCMGSALWCSTTGGEAIAAAAALLWSAHRPRLGGGNAAASSSSSARWLVRAPGQRWRHPQLNEDAPQHKLIQQLLECGYLIAPTHTDCRWSVSTSGYCAPVMGLTCPRIGLRGRRAGCCASGGSASDGAAAGAGGCTSPPTAQPQTSTHTRPGRLLAPAQPVWRPLPYKPVWLRPTGMLDPTTHGSRKVEQFVGAASTGGRTHLGALAAGCPGDGRRRRAGDRHIRGIGGVVLQHVMLGESGF